MDYFVDQVKQGFAKVVQSATDSHIFNELPDCSMLSNSDKLSIKLKDPQMYLFFRTNYLLSRHNALINHWTRNTNFQSITFLIRNEENRKQTLMVAELQSGLGINIKTNVGKPIMTVRTPNNAGFSLGKIMHPAQATLYKVELYYVETRKIQIIKASSPVGEQYVVIKTPSREPVMKIEKVLVSMYPLGKAVGLIGTSCVYWLKRNDGTILGYIRPKLVHKSNTLVLKFR